MVKGIGVDVVAVSRMREWLKDEYLVQRYFAPVEREAIYERKDGAALSLAARFAAKEAFAKALGTGFRGFHMREVWVVNDGMGKPELHVTGGAQQALHRMGANHILVSLTHEQEHAIAMVVIEG